MRERATAAVKTPDSKRPRVISQTRQADISASPTSISEQIAVLQRSIGNQGVARLYRTGILQAQLRIGQAGDRYEQEADTVAAQVMRMPDDAVDSRQSTIFFGQGEYSPGSSAGRRLLAHELTQTFQQNTGNTNGMCIQRDLEEDINALLERIVPSPGIAENRIPVIEALCRMAMGHEDARIPVRRRILREIFELVSDVSEASRLHTRLSNRIRGDSLSEVFHDQLSTVTRNEMLETLHRRVTRVNLVVEAARHVPQWRFGTPEENDGICLNPSYWLVSYQARLGDVTILANNQSRRGLSAWQALRRDPGWTGRYDELTVDITIIESASAAIDDAWNEESTDRYAVDCNIAANLVQLRGMYLYYLSQGREQGRSPADARRVFDRDYTDTFELRFSGSRSHGAAGPSTMALSGLIGERSAMTELAQDRIPIVAGPAFGGRVVSGDWVTIDSTDIIHGVYSYENAIYLGGNQFFGHPLGIFTPEGYTAHIHRNCRQSRNSNIARILGLPPGVVWPAAPAALLRALYVKPIGRPRNPHIRF